MPVDTLPPPPVYHPAYTAPLPPDPVHEPPSVADPDEHAEDKALVAELLQEELAPRRADWIATASTSPPQVPEHMADHADQPTVLRDLSPISAIPMCLHRRSQRRRIGNAAGGRTKIRGTRVALQTIGQRTNTSQGGF